MFPGALHIETQSPQCTYFGGGFTSFGRRTLAGQPGEVHRSTSSAGAAVTAPAVLAAEAVAEAIAEVPVAVLGQAAEAAAVAVVVEAAAAAVAVAVAVALAVAIAQAIVVRAAVGRDARKVHLCGNRLGATPPSDQSVSNCPSLRQRLCIDRG